MPATPVGDAADVHRQGAVSPLRHAAPGEVQGVFPHGEPLCGQLSVRQVSLLPGERQVAVTEKVTSLPAERVRRQPERPRSGMDYPAARERQRPGGQRQVPAVRGKQTTGQVRLPADVQREVSLPGLCQYAVRRRQVRRGNLQPRSLQLPAVCHHRRRGREGQSVLSLQVAVPQAEAAGTGQEAQSAGIRRTVIQSDIRPLQLRIPGGSHLPAVLQVTCGTEAELTVTRGFSAAVIPGGEQTVVVRL
ncbi:TPA: hypothetical protein ACS9WW_004168 [Salmonella enterica subsp. enterica serovar Muenchen]